MGARKIENQAWFIGYFVESGGGIMPAVDQYLSQYLPNEEERAARSRRASKAITYGQYNLNELIAELNNIVKTSGKWEATRVQGYRLKPVDMTGYNWARYRQEHQPKGPPPAVPKRNWYGLWHATMEKRACRAVNQMKRSALSIKEGMRSSSRFGIRYMAATAPPIRTGFWDRVAKPTYGRLVKHLKKVGLPLSRQLCKKASVTAHLPLGYEAIRLSRA